MVDGGSSCGGIGLDGSKCGESDWYGVACVVELSSGVFLGQWIICSDLGAVVGGGTRPDEMRLPVEVGLGLGTSGGLRKFDSEGDPVFMQVEGSKECGLKGGLSCGSIGHVSVFSASGATGEVVVGILDSDLQGSDSVLADCDGHASGVALGGVVITEWGIITEEELTFLGKGVVGFVTESTTPLRVLGAFSYGLQGGGVGDCCVSVRGDSSA